MANNLKHIDDNNFKDTISRGVTLIDFYADWCGPCRTIAPVVEELATEFAGQVTVAKLDVDNSQKTAAELRIMSIPTLIVFKDGKEIDRLVGVHDKAGLKRLIAAAH